MESLGDAKKFREGFQYLRTRDPRLAKVMERYGPIKFEPEGDLFESLVESILSQQLAGPAARSIITKVRAIYSDGKLEAEEIFKTPTRKLRGAGVSPQKLRYLKDLSSRVAKGKIDLEALREMSDEEIISTLDEVKGIGPWTVHMLLIFTLGRTNVLPVNDLGIKKGVQRLYSLKELPKEADIKKLGENWHPYRSIASLYVWRHKDED